MRPRSFCSVLLLIVPWIPGGHGPVAPPPGRAAYRPPVAAPVVDPFRRPSGPYGPGNRGLDYATAPGTPVGAIGPGVVVFAGTIAHERFVTVLHPDGLRSSYSFLASIEVVVGQSVMAGQEVGTSGPHLQLGVRRGEDYLDPATLFGRRRPPHLVRPCALACRSSTTAPRS